MVAFYNMARYFATNCKDACKKLRDDNLVYILKIFLLRILYTGCPRRNVPDFGRVFLMLRYTDITQNTYNQS